MGAKKDLKTDYKVTQKGMAAILGNLLTTQSGLGQNLSGVNRRSLDAMRRMTARQGARMDRIQDVGQKVIDNRYGSVIGSDPNLLKGVARLGQSQAKVAKGSLKAGELQMRAGNEAMDIYQQAAQTTADAAQYELAQALRDRNKAVQDGTAVGGGGENFQKAATAITNMQVNGETQASVEHMLGAFKLQYNLGPQAMTRLRGMVEAMYGTSGGGDTGAVTSTEQGQAFAEAHGGASPSAFLGEDTRTALNKAAWAAFAKDPSAKVPDTATAQAIAGVKFTSDGKYSAIDPSTGEAVEVSADYYAAAIAYVQSEWQRMQARNGGTNPTTTPDGQGPAPAGESAAPTAAPRDPTGPPSERYATDDVPPSGPIQGPPTQAPAPVPTGPTDATGIDPALVQEQYIFEKDHREGGVSGSTAARAAVSGMAISTADYAAIKEMTGIDVRDRSAESIGKLKDWLVKHGLIPATTPTISPA